MMCTRYDSIGNAVTTDHLDEVVRLRQIIDEAADILEQEYRRSSNLTVASVAVGLRLAREVNKSGSQ